MLVLDDGGDIAPGGLGGYYDEDVRLLSGLRVLLGDRRLRPLGAARDGPAAAAFVSCLEGTPDGDPAVVVVRRWELRDAARLSFEVRTSDAGLAGLPLRIEVEADFALARRGLPDLPPPARWRVADGLHATGAGVAVAVEAPGAAYGPGSVTIPAGDGPTWRAEVHIRPRAVDRPARAPVFRPALSVADTAPTWRASVEAALADLGALETAVPGLDLRYPAAGAPWYMALFGRDSLLTAWSLLIAGTGPSLDVLRALGRFQGRGHDARTGEQPGRILHELRTGRMGVFGLPPGRPYYGTADAGLLFVMLLAEAHRWGASEATVRALLPAARDALAWAVGDGDVDGDGYLEHQPDPDGLANQGWKDSPGAMVHADGSRATPPIAPAEVQAYLFAARQALADLEERLGEPGRAGDLRAEALQLRAAFQRDFWSSQRQLLAMALDGDKRPLAVASSNIGHVLWSGLLDEPLGGLAAGRLVQEDLDTGWGLRTLGSAEVAYEPLGYHTGAVWPHDTALAIAGLRRYGHHGAAARLTAGLLEAAAAFGWRLPELFGGFDDVTVSRPVAHPLACRPQAWSAAAPLLLLRVALGLDPDVPAGRVVLAPRLPAGVTLDVSGIAVGDGRLDVRATGNRVEVLHAPPGLTVLSA